MSEEKPIWTGTRSQVINLPETSLNRRRAVLPLACITLLGIGLSGCASTQDVRETGVERTFYSTKSAQMLTMCIDKNTDGRYFNSLRTNIKNLDSGYYEIVVRNGALVDSVVQVTATDTGSVALFRFGGVSSTLPDDSLTMMTKDCG